LRSSNTCIATAVLAVLVHVPVRAEASRCEFDSSIVNAATGAEHRSVSLPLSRDWTLGFVQQGEQRWIDLTLGSFGGNGASLEEGQRLVTRYQDGTIMELFSTNVAVPKVNGSYKEYTFRFDAPPEALVVLSNLPLEGYQMELFSELMSGSTTKSVQKSIEHLASCILEPKFRD